MGRVSMVDGHIDGSDTCVICGKDIPEGSQVCVICGDVPKKNTISAIHEMCIKRDKEIDSAILGEIKQIAIENGIKTEVVLNDKAIINALEKQIPKKVIKEKNYSHGRYTVAKCPTCDGLLGLYSFAETSFKCCCECGQALDWSDTE